MKNKPVREVRRNGDIGYYNEVGQFHREDGPAWIGADGTEMWYFKGRRHREDGPAVIRGDGTQMYYLNGIFYGGSLYCLPKSRS